jgi:hypothetical protein
MWYGLTRGTYGMLEQVVRTLIRLLLVFFWSLCYRVPSRTSFNCDTVLVHTFSNVVTNFTCCGSAVSDNLFCVEGTTLPHRTVCHHHTLVSCDTYLSYFRLRVYRGEDVPETVSSVTPIVAVCVHSWRNCGLSFISHHLL